MSSIEPNSTRLSQLSPLKQALLAIEDLQARLKVAELPQNEPIAIIGMACRFPGAKNVEAFWKLLYEGVDAVREVPKDRWNMDEFYDADPDAPGKLSTRWAGLIDGIDQFDPEFFGISPREAAFMDPQQRLLLEVTWEAIESAGQSPRTLATGQTGVFVGMTSDEYALQSYREGDLSRFNAYFATGIARSVAAGRLSYTLGLSGASMSIDTACSSSLVAVHTACMHLRMRECRMALAGGANVVLSPEIGIAFSKAHMMASDGRCKAFDSRADGFVRGEGCGMVVLKLLSDAVADGDPILAVIRGSAINQDGRSSGMTAPNGSAQEAVIRTALERAGMRPDEVGYVEAHGTGTSLGDPIEAHALARALGKGRDASHPLVIGAAKTNVGHLESAAGIVGLIKAVLVLEQEHIPPNLHFEKLNPHIDWSGVPVEMPVEGRAWPRGERRRVVGISAFGFSGTNAHVIVEETQLSPRVEAAWKRPVHLLAFSAKTETALSELTAKYAEVLESNAYLVANTCYTANAGRAHFEHRVAVYGSDAKELHEALKKHPLGQRVVDREGVRPVFLFPDEGPQYASMGKDLYETQPVFRAALDECAASLRGELDKPLLELLWGNESEHLDETVYTQPALFAVEWCLAKMWQSWGIEPSLVAGHGVGEYVAACVAGVYSLEDGLKLIAGRGRLMQAVNESGEMAENELISGYEAELQVAEERLKRAGLSVQPSHGSRAFHSPQMDEILDAFDAVARGVKFRSPQVRLISSVTGRLVGHQEMSQSGYWRQQVRNPVRFQQAMETLRSDGNAVFLEVGPGDTLTELGQQSVAITQAIWMTSLQKERGAWPQILDSLAQLYMRGTDVNWEAYDRMYGRSKVQLPTYPFQRQRYWVAPPAEMVRSEKKSQLNKVVESVIETIAERDAEQKWFYRVGWKRKDLSGAAVVRVRRNWILLADKTGVAEALSERIRADGYRCEILEGGLDDRRLVDATGIVDMRWMDATEGSTEPACMALTELVREVPQVKRCETSVWSVTRGARATGLEDRAVLPWLAPVWALGRTAASEHPDFWSGMVDLDSAAGAVANAEMLWRHLVSFDGEEEVAFRNGTRVATRLERYMPPPGPEGPNLSGTVAYLITGGFGALGLEVARWLVRGGARNLILMGRAALPPRSEWSGLLESDTRSHAVTVVLELERQGVEVETVAVDVADAVALKAFVRTYEGRSGIMIRGVVHAAGAMQHALVSDTTTDVLRVAFRSKVDGTWVLQDQFMDRALDFFVTFSSASAVLSSPRLGSYAAANAFLDAMAEYRNHKGLPSLSVNWGIWTGVGMAAMPDDPARTVGDGGMTGMTVAQGLACLGRLMASSRGQVCVLPLDWKRWSELYPAYMAKPFFSEVVEAASGRVGRAGPAYGLLDQLKGAPEAIRVDLIRDFVQKIAAGLLGFPDGHQLDISRPLNDVGLDSLMSLELRNQIAAAVGQSLPATLLFNHPAAEDIAQYLAKLLFRETGTAELIPAEKRSSLDEIQDLSDEEVDRMLAARLG